MFKRRSSENKYCRLVPQLCLLTVTALTLVMGVVILFNSTLGWFAQNRNVSGEGMGVQVESIDAQAEYTVYLFDAKENAVRYTGDGKANEPLLDDLHMQIHDVIFKSRNRYTPAVIHIHLYDISEEYRTNGTVSLTLTRDGSAAYETGDGGALLLPDLTTSILRFTLVNNDGTSWLGSDADPDKAAKETYDNVDDSLYAKIVTNKDYADTASMDIYSNVFTTVTKGTVGITNITKLSDMTLSVGYSAAETAGGELDLFLYITYDEALVSDFEHASGIDTSATSVGKITTLLNDLTSLEIRFDSH